MQRVYVTRMVPEAALARMNGKLDWAVNIDDRVLERDELLAYEEKENH